MMLVVSSPLEKPKCLALKWTSFVMVCTPSSKPREKICRNDGKTCCHWSCVDRSTGTFLIFSKWMFYELLWTSMMFLFLGASAKFRHGTSRFLNSPWITSLGLWSMTKVKASSLEVMEMFPSWSFPWRWTFTCLLRRVSLWNIFHSYDLLYNHIISRIYDNICI